MKRFTRILAMLIIAALMTFGFAFAAQPEHTAVTEPHEGQDEFSKLYSMMENSCPHENLIDEGVSSTDEILESTTRTHHTFSYIDCQVYYCSDCGEYIHEPVSERTSYTLPHWWFNGNCGICGMKNPCTHENLSVYETYRTDLVVDNTDADADGHTVSFLEMYSCTCKICGENLEIPGEERITVTEPHEWDYGFCMWCDAENPCPHENRTFSNTEYDYIDLIDYNAAEHTLLGYEYRIFKCSDCGDTIYESSEEPISVTEAHDWWDNYCEWCPADNTCPHDSTYLKERNINVLLVTEITEENHSFTYRDEHFIACSDCGNRTWEIINEAATLTEAHQWDDGECITCGKKNTTAELPAPGTLHLSALPGERFSVYGTELPETIDPKLVSYRVLDEDVLRIDDDGVIEVLAGGTGEAEILYNGNKVYTLSVKAGNIDTILVPADLSVIQSEAFTGSSILAVDLSGCSNLQLDGSAFANCPQLQRVLLPEEAKLADGAFSNCELLVLLCRNADQIEYAVQNDLAYVLMK